MSFEIVTTHFVAHEPDLDGAYELYLNRIRASGVEIAAVSPRPHPIEDEYVLWDLRCQAAYDNLAAPEDLQLYELNALVDFSTTNRDEALDYFFFEDMGGPTRFAAALGGLSDLTLRDEPTGPSPLPPSFISAPRSTWRWRNSFSTTPSPPSTPSPTNPSSPHSRAPNMLILSARSGFATPP